MKRLDKFVAFTQTSWQAVPMMIIFLLLLSGCRKAPSRVDPTRRPDNRHDLLITFPEIGIPETNEWGQPQKGVKTSAGRIAETIPIGKILRLRGKFVVSGEGKAPVSVVVFVSPPGKTAFRDAYSSHTINCFHDPYPSSESTFEGDIRLSIGKDRPGKAWISIFALAKSYDDLVPIAHISCNLAENIGTANMTERNENNEAGKVSEFFVQLDKP
jgi:hypothetical protein